MGRNRIKYGQRGGGSGGGGRGGGGGGGSVAELQISGPGQAISPCEVEESEISSESDLAKEVESRSEGKSASVQSKTCKTLRRCPGSLSRFLGGKFNTIDEDYFTV
jgi:hypothetical protein